MQWHMDGRVHCLLMLGAKYSPIIGEEFVIQDD